MDGNRQAWRGAAACLGRKPQAGLPSESACVRPRSLVCYPPTIRPQRRDGVARSSQQPWRTFLSNPTRRQLLRVGGLGGAGPGAAGAVAGALRPQQANGPGAGEVVHLHRAVRRVPATSTASTPSPTPRRTSAARTSRSPRPSPGVRVGELLPRLARLADRYCLVRSMTHGNGGHDGGMHVCMTGHSGPDAGHALLRLRRGARCGRRGRNVPSYVWLQNLAGDVQPRYLTGGFLGAGVRPAARRHRPRQPVGPDLPLPGASTRRRTCPHERLPQPAATC